MPKLTAPSAEAAYPVQIAAKVSAATIEVVINEESQGLSLDGTEGLAAIFTAVAPAFCPTADALAAWCEYTTTLGPKPKEKDVALEKLNAALDPGPFLTGAAITAADVAVALALPKPYQQAIGSGGKNKAAQAWLEAVMAHPEVDAVVPKEAGKSDADKEAKRLAKLAEKEAKKAKLEAKKAKAQEEAKAKEASGGGKKAAQKAEAEAAAAAKKAAEEAELKEALELIKATPDGTKKSVASEMLKTYHPMIVEAKWYQWWEKCGFFTPENGSTKPKFVIVIPPPNVTGVLHIGHALTNSVQDTLVRWRRMQGYDALWLPGTDHAGIATQTVVEKKLMRERGQTRHELGRENFLKEVWKWKETSGNTICSQLRRLGSSLDWTRECFTMDPKLSHAVNEAFVQMHAKGLIYRDNRLVNWCCTLKTAISDIEVDYLDLDGETLVSVPGYDTKVEFGVITSFAYPLEDGSGEIVVATTRPETMLGDTAVAVHPDDPRYTSFHGKFVVHPFNGRKLPIIQDAELVDMSFGTGAVKITPAHDPNDFATGKRHGLEFINCFTDLGVLNENGGPYEGMKRFDVRTKVVADLEAKGLYRGKANNPMRLGLCSRSKDVIEPLIKPQWWVNCEKMAADSVAAVREGKMDIVPPVFEATWYRWLENIRDWCISRQLWWGHRIPAYYITLAGETGEYVGTNETMSRWVVGRTEADALALAQERFPGQEVTLTQDPDVLDTWFSSGLFPFSTMGWPEKTPDLDDFFPGALLETGHDILFFWVARMVMMSIALTGKIPFKQVYLHAMVRDAHGRKMSKSLGNVIDPIQVIEGIALEDLHATLLNGNLDEKEVKKAQQGQTEDFPNGIPECGTDALRFALVAYTTQARDVNLDILRVHGYRTWCNKLWNATRFAMMNLTDGFMPTPALGAAEVAALPLAGQWVVSRLQRAVVATGEALEKFDFAAATTAVYAFWQYDLCDVFIELMKPLVQSSDLAVVQGVRNALWWSMDVGLRLLHPFMPFVTEELWQRLPRPAADLEKIPSIMLAPYPEPTPAWDSAATEAKMDLLMEVVKCLRSERSKYGLTTKQKTTAYILCQTAEAAAAVTEGALYVATLTSSESVAAVGSTTDVPAGCAVSIVNEQCSVYLLLKGILKPEEELQKLGKRQQTTAQQKADLAKKMATPTYQEKVPESVKEEDLSKAAKLEAELSAIAEAIEAFTKMELEG